MQPTVIVNHHRQTALIVAASGSKLQLIKLGKGQLKVTSLTPSELETQGYQVSDYSPCQAARAYLQHGGGISVRARKYLEGITENKFSETLTLF